MRAKSRKSVAVSRAGFISYRIYYELNNAHVVCVCVYALTSKRERSGQTVQGIGIVVDGIQFKLCVCQPVNKHTYFQDMYTVWKYIIITFKKEMKTS